MESRTKQLIGFLQGELAIPSDKIPDIIQQCQNLNRLPVILWQQKLVTIVTKPIVRHGQTRSYLLV